MWFRVLRGIPSQWEYETSHGETLSESLWMMRKHISRHSAYNFEMWKSRYRSQKEENEFIKEIKKENKELYTKIKHRKKNAWLV